MNDISYYNPNTSSPPYISISHLSNHPVSQVATVKQPLLLPLKGYDGLSDGVWTRRTPTTDSAMAFGGFVPLRRLPRWCLGVSYPFNGFRDGVWLFRTPTTVSAMAFGGFVPLQRVQNVGFKAIIYKFTHKKELGLDRF